MLEANTFGAGDEVRCVGDEHSSAGDEHAENTRLNFSHMHIANYQQLPNRTNVQMIASHSYSHLKMGTLMLQRSKRSIK